MSARSAAKEWFKLLEVFTLLLVLPTVFFYFISSYSLLPLRFGYYFIVTLFVFQAGISYLYSFSAFKSNRLSAVEKNVYRFIPKATFIVSAYLPNEIGVIEATLNNILQNVERPSKGVEVILAYNTPHMQGIEPRLREMSYKWPELILANAYGSRSKSENLNYVLGLASGDIIVLLDADHLVGRDCLGLAWQRLSNGYDVVQGHCKIRNGRKSFVSALVEVEFEAIYGISHYAKTRIFDSTLFGGSNGYWKAAVIKEIKFSPDKLTEDIDSTLRAILKGYRIVHDRRIISSELSPGTLAGLWHQRKRWAQGWFQCSVKYQWQILISGYLSLGQKFLWTSLLLWRVFYDIVSHFLWPIVFAFWLYRGKVFFPMNGYIWFALFFTLFSGPFEAVVAYKNSSAPRAPLWQYLYYAFMAFPYTLFKNTIQVVAIRDELSGERQWVISRRGEK